MFYTTQDGGFISGRGYTLCMAPVAAETRQKSQLWNFLPSKSKGPWFPAGIPNPNWG